MPELKANKTYTANYIASEQFDCTEYMLYGASAFGYRIYSIVLVIFFRPRPVAEQYLVSHLFSYALTDFLFMVPQRHKLLQFV